MAWLCVFIIIVTIVSLLSQSKIIHITYLQKHLLYTHKSPNLTYAHARPGGECVNKYVVIQKYWYFLFKGSKSFKFVNESIL